MGAHHQIIEEFLISMHQIIHSSEIDTSWLIYSKLLILLKWLIYTKDFLMFCNNMDCKRNIGDM